MASVGLYISEPGSQRSPTIGLPRNAPLNSDSKFPVGCKPRTDTRHICVTGCKMCLPLIVTIILHVPCISHDVQPISLFDRNSHHFRLNGTGKYNGKRVR